MAKDAGGGNFKAPNEAQDFMEFFFGICFGLISCKRFPITVLLAVSIGHTVCNGVSCEGGDQSWGKGRLAAMPFAVKPPILKPKTPRL